MIEFTLEGKLNLEKLEKGDFLTEDILRAATGLDARENAQEWAFAILQIRETLRSEYKIFCRGEGRNVRLLKDTEATYYKANRARLHRKSQQRDYADLLDVDENNLDQITRQHHERHKFEISMYLSAQTTASKQIRVQQSEEEKAKQQNSNSVQQSQIKVISIGGKKQHGTEINESPTNGDTCPDASQWTDGEPTVSAGEADENPDIETRQDG